MPGSARNVSTQTGMQRKQAKASVVFLSCLRRKTGERGQSSRRSKRHSCRAGSETPAGDCCQGYNRKEGQDIPLLRKCCTCPSKEEARGRCLRQLDQERKRGGVGEALLKESQQKWDAPLRCLYRRGVPSVVGVGGDGPVVAMECSGDGSSASRPSTPYRSLFIL